MNTFADITTLRVGGAVGSIERVPTIDALVEAVRTYKENEKEFLIVGGGSNILAHDDTYPGTVIIPEARTITYEENGDTVTVVTEAGVVWDDLVGETVDRGLWGLENLTDIPGNVGAAPLQNIGAYGADVAQTISWVEVFDTKMLETRKLTNRELNFGYRTSIIKVERPRYVVLRVAFQLTKQGTPNTEYKDLQQVFGVTTPSQQEVREAVRAIRKSKFPDLKKYGTAGSFFMNPTISEDEYKTLTQKYPDVPAFPVPEGCKLSLAWILDHVVGAKGMSVGGAHVWHKQPLVIATDSGTRAHDVRTLTQQLTQKVFNATHIRIVPEVFVM